MSQSGPPLANACVAASGIHAQCTDILCDAATSCPGTTQCLQVKLPFPPCTDPTSPWMPLFAAGPPPPRKGGPGGPEPDFDGDHHGGLQETSTVIQPLAHSTTTSAMPSNTNISNGGFGVGISDTGSNSNNHDIHSNSIGNLGFIVGVAAFAVITVLAVALLVSRESRRRRELLQVKALEQNPPKRYSGVAILMGRKRMNTNSSLPELNSIRPPSSPLPPLPFAVGALPFALPEHTGRGARLPFACKDDFFDDSASSRSGSASGLQSPAISDDSSIYIDQVRVVNQVENLFFTQGQESGDLEASIRTSASGSGDVAASGSGFSRSRLRDATRLSSSGPGEKRGLVARNGVQDFRTFNLKVLEEGEDEEPDDTEGELVRLTSVGAGRHVLVDNVVDMSNGEGGAEVVELK
ncbi:UNVERIFIED_CONTAM: hypothetical protein HDU68_000215 [Siphonaria sp. JEL0065]|nr:hypothetical protein HDU68_000215 [Siphonaria sp. JEL0065]